MASRRASLMRFSSLDRYEGQPVAQETSGEGLWLLCARRGAITRNCSSCHFPAPSTCSSCSSIPSRRQFPFIPRSLFPCTSLKRSFVGVFYCRKPTYPLPSPSFVLFLSPSFSARPFSRRCRIHPVFPATPTGLYLAVSSGEASPWIRS